MADFKRKMVIQRVRNPNDDSQWVDIAMTTELAVEIRKSTQPPTANNKYLAKATGMQAEDQKNYQRYIWQFAALQLGDPTEQSEEFEVASEDDLKAAAQQFADAHPD